MAKKTNYTSNGVEYFRIVRKVGMKVDKYGNWVDDKKAFYGSCKSDAEKKFQEYMSKKDSGTGSNKCVGKLIDEWIEKVYKNSEQADSTKKKYISAYERIFKKSSLAGRNIDDVTALDIQELYNNCNQCISAIKALHNLLRRFYKYVDLNGIYKDITNSLKVPTKRSISAEYEEIDVWQDDDLKRLISAFDGRLLKFLIVLAVNTGMRFSELLALRYDDINNGVVRVNKQLYEPSSSNVESGNVIKPTKTTNSNRLIPLADQVLKEFEIHKELHQQQMKNNGYTTEYIFTTAHGTFYWQRNISRSIKRACTKAQIPYHKFHAFRHTFATNLSREGVAIEETSKLLGHSDISMTAKYYVFVDATAKKAAVESIVRHSLVS